MGLREEWIHTIYDGMVVQFLHRCWLHSRFHRRWLQQRLHSGLTLTVRTGNRTIISQSVYEWGGTQSARLSKDVVTHDDISFILEPFCELPDTWLSRYLLKRVFRNQRWVVGAYIEYYEQGWGYRRGHITTEMDVGGRGIIVNPRKQKLEVSWILAIPPTSL